MKKYTWMPIAMTLGLLVQPYCCAAEFTDPIVIEAEDFASQHLDDKRRWFIVSEGHTEHPYADNDVAHLEGASGGKYLEILPDTRTNHSEDLLPGENFTDTPGEVAVLSYPVFFEKAGRYYVWARAFSTGSEDNGMHIGLDGDWPETSQRLQLCEGKNQWTWSSARRTAKKHCGEPNTIWIDIQTHGLHLLTVSMREDGFELDKLLLTQDPTYVPQGEGPKSSASPKVELKKKSSFIGISEYKNLLTATKDFTFSEQDKVPFYVHEKMQALAINAAKEKYRDQFASARYVVTDKKSKTVSMTLVTLMETDGESRYQVHVNDKLLGEFKNPVTSKDYQEAYFKMSDVVLNPGDVITVSSMAVTNGKIPEGDGTAYSRGRWRGLVLQ